MKSFLRIPLFLILYNYIFPIRLVAFPFFAELILGASFLYFMGVTSLKHRAHVIFSREVIMLIVGWAVLLSVAFISIIVNGTYDFGMPQVLLNYLFTLIYALLFVVTLMSGGFGRKISVNYVLKVVAVCCLIVAVSVFLDVLSPAAKQLFLTYIYKTGNIDYADSFRASGLSASGGAALSFGLALGCGISLLLAVTSLNSVNRAFFYISALLILSATIFVGRSGLVFSLVFLLVSFRHISLGKLSYLLVALVVVGIVAASLLPLLSDDASSYFSNHALEVVNNYKDNGKIESSTTDAVEGMYFVPKFEHLLLGAGFLNVPSSGYILPDPGYMKVLLSFGIFGSALFYLMSFHITRKSFVLLRKAVGGGELLIIVILLSFYIFEFKESAFYQNYEFRILMLCYAFFVVDKSFNRFSARASLENVSG